MKSAATIRSRWSSGSARRARLCGSIKSRQIRAKVLLAEPCSPVMTRIGCGPVGQEGGGQPGDQERQLGGLDVDKFLQECNRAVARRQGRRTLAR